MLAPSVSVILHFPVVYQEVKPCFESRLTRLSCKQLDSVHYTSQTILLPVYIVYCKSFRCHVMHLSLDHSLHDMTFKSRQHVPGFISYGAWKKQRHACQAPHTLRESS
jgi:hypothetical protein